MERVDSGLNVVDEILQEGGIKSERISFFVQIEPDEELFAPWAERDGGRAGLPPYEVLAFEDFAVVFSP